MDGTLYLHRIYCLHGATGALTSAAVSTDTVLNVDSATIADSTITVGAQITLSDNGAASAAMTITVVGMTSLTVMSGPGADFPTGSIVTRLPHWAESWRSDDMLMMTCPEDMGHMTQANSAHIVETRATDEVRIRQCASAANHPELITVPLTASAGTTDTATLSRPSETIIVGGLVWTENVHLGDTLDVLVSPKMASGTITVDAKIGDTVLNVGDSVLVFATLDRHICVDGLGDLGRITAVDMDAKTVTVGQPIVAAVAANTAIKIAKVIMLGTRLPSFQTEIRIGFNSLNKETLPESAEIIATYHNNDLLLAGNILLGISILST